MNSAKPDTNSTTTKKRNRIILAFAFCIALPFVTVQYVQGKRWHERLQSTGQQTQIVTTPITGSNGVKSIRYYFTTTNGKRIERVQKCPDGYLQYTNATVIYDPENPDAFEFLSDFKLYSPAYRALFFFAFYLPLLTGVMYGFFKIALMLYFRFTQK